MAGTMSLRRLVTPDSEAASLPLPASGTVIVSAVAPRLTSVSIDPCWTTLAVARLRRSATAAWTSGAFTFAAFTTTVAVCNSLGNVFSMRL